MAMTKEEFRRRWDSGPDGGGITDDEVADCAKAWGLYDRPRCAQRDHVIMKVVKAAGCRDLPEEEEQMAVDEDELTLNVHAPEGDA